jgi:hypothetical protein
MFLFMWFGSLGVRDCTFSDDADHALCVNNKRQTQIGMKPHELCLFISSDSAYVSLHYALELQ